MISRFLPAAGLAAALAFAQAAAAAECVVPAKPGGGMDLTCKLARAGLGLAPARSRPPLQISYMPGGVGAVAWNAILSNRKTHHDTLIAFSGGSLLNLALGKYGDASHRDARWVAAVGADYGMVAVPAQSPYRNLRELLQAIDRTPGQVAIGASGTAGSQDWIKMRVLARQAGFAPKKLRFVAFEGGGDAITAMLAGYVQAISGDVSETTSDALAGRVRILAVFSEERLPGPLASVPTAREQGFDLVWPIVRGFYMGRNATDDEYRSWVAAFNDMLAAPGFDALRTAHGLYPFSLTGDALSAYVEKTVGEYSRQAAEPGSRR